MGIFLIQILLALTSSALTFETPQFQTVYQWRELEFEFPTSLDKTYAELTGSYVHGISAPFDVDLDYMPRIGIDGIDQKLANKSYRTFVTIPRLTTGVPVTLATVEERPTGPILRPYPNYLLQLSHGMNCNGITSVFRIFIDECRRLWVLDTGKIGKIQFCPPQLLVFDLKTDTLTKRYRFPRSQYKTCVSLLVTPVVDVRDSCMNTFVYIADVKGFGLLVYDNAKDTSWRIENKLFYPDPDYGTFNIAGETFDLMDGIIGLAVTPKTFRGERYLFFHSLASGTENAVPLRALDNEATWKDTMEAVPRSFMEIGSRNTQSAAQAMDSNGNLFFGLMDAISVASWNISSSYSSENIRIASRNLTTLQFASGLKVKKNKQDQEEVLVLTNRLQKIKAGTKNSNEVNFRILGCRVDDLLQNRPCSPVK